MLGPDSNDRPAATLPRRPAAAPVIIWLTDPRGELAFTNDAYPRYFGVTLDQLRGPRRPQLLHPEDEPAFRVAFARATERREPFHALARVRRVDGAWRWIESYGVPRFSGGRFVGMVGSSTDVTEPQTGGLGSATPARGTARMAGVDRVAATAMLERQASRLRRLIEMLELAGERAGARLATQVHDDLQRLRLALRAGSRGAPAAPVAGAPGPAPTGPGADDTEGTRRRVEAAVERLTRAASRHAVLTDRELDVVQHLMANGRVRTIAERLGRSQHTVRNHLRAVFRKLGVHSQTELIRAVTAHLR